MIKDAATERPAHSDAGETDAIVARALRERSRRKWLQRLAQVLLLVGLLAAWEIFAGKPGSHPWVLIDEFYVSRPSHMVDALVRWTQRGVLFDAILTTLTTMALGYILGFVAGLVAGFVVGSNRWLGSVLGPFVGALNSIPHLALMPLFLVWFGIGIESKIVYVSTSVFMVIFYNTFAGVRDVQPELVDTLKIMGAGRFALNWKVILPSAVTWILIGMRLTVPYALIGAVTAEILSANSGLGYLLTQSASQFYIDGVYASIFVMMIVGLVLNYAVIFVENRLLAWKVRDRDD